MVRLQRPVAEADFDPRGAVQLAPVPPGVYVLEVSAKGGQLPKYDVKTPTVAVGSEKRDVNVPTVKTEKREVKVPTVDVKPPK